jgi:hypothetical protein
MNTAPDPRSSLAAFASDPVVQSVLGVLVLLIVSAIAVYYLAKLRDSNTETQQLDELLRKNFEEMRSEGDIDEQEFRKIKALLREGNNRPSPAATEKESAPRSTESVELPDQGAS